MKFSILAPSCMVDPNVDHGFMEDSQGRTNILRSPFFDLNLNVDDSVEDYVDRIIFTLTQVVEEHLPTGPWLIMGRPPIPQSPATFPTTKILGSFFLVVISFLVWSIFLS
ncbi:hypothetical protein M5K25_015784 [Dendrobium thyrsiflorum]|uniref:Uncharacterized protein n=1 Tax=Dendrobium thyrsiflorum TaxID=117978 RepID=A0ABD0UY57_DENTH